MLVCLLFASSYLLLAQVDVVGKVISAHDKLPIPGVQVFETANPSNGTITDLNGNFSLKLPSMGLKVSFSYIGMKAQEITINDLQPLSIVMREDVEVLDEVIVTAIGIKQEKKSLGYAAQDVKADEVQKSGETNLVNALNAKVAGVEIVSSSGSPGASASISIRGRTSLLGNNSPLFVVDGIPIDNSFEGSNTSDRSNRAIDLNPDDIESLTVLKGPAASALYGIRAANGAIIISTKSGSLKQKGTISFSSSVAFDQVNKLPQKQVLFAQGHYVDGQATYFGPVNERNSWGPRYTDLRYDGNSDYLYDRNGAIVLATHPSAGEQTVKPYNNAEKFFDTGISFNNHLSFSAGNEKSNYYMSLSNFKQSGVVPLSDFARNTFKLSGATEINKRLKVSSSVSYVNSGGHRMQRGSNASGVMFGLMRSPESFDLSNGLQDPVNQPESYMFADGSPRTFYFDADNPYWSVNMNKVTDNVNRVMGYAQLNYELADWIHATFRLGIDHYSEEVSDYLSNGSADYYGVGIMNNENKLFNSLTSDFLLRAEKSLSDDLSFSAIVGHNFYDESVRYVSMRGEQFIIPYFYDMSNVETVTNADNQLYNYRILGVFYEAKLNYKNYVYLSTTGRNDWSSTLPKASRSFFYPSVNLGFIFTEAFGLSKSKTFPYGKLRANFATVGNDAPLYSLYSYYSSVSPVQGQTSFLPQSTIGNQGLEPENTYSWEIGFDLRFFENKIGLDFTYYNTQSASQILDVTIPFSSGYSQMTINAGTIENKGFEAQFTGKPIERKNLRWDFLLNFSKNKNLVKEISEGLPYLETGSNYGVASTQNVFVEGQPYGVIWGSRWLRNDDGEVLIDDRGLPIVDSEKGIIGDPNPDWTMGIRNSLTFYGITLSALIDVRKGGDVFNGTVAVMKSLGTHQSTENREELFVYEGIRESDGTPNTTEISYYDFYTNYGLVGVSEENIEDGSWIRLRDVGLSYSLPEKWLNPIGIRRIDVGISGRNLLLFTNYSGIDPETNLSGASNSFGRDYFNMPNTKSLSFNVKFTF